MSQSPPVNAAPANAPAIETENPEAEYARRLALRQDDTTRWTKAHYALGNAKLAVVGMGALFLYLIFGAHWLSAGWLALPVVLFTGLARRHETVLQALQGAERAANYYTRGLRRLLDRWPGEGVSGGRFLQRDHPYARDLDLFGSGSLFQRLCLARTEAGENCLARWLLTPAAPDVIRARQAAVVELRPRLDLREDLSVQGEAIRAALDPAAITRWSKTLPLPGLKRLRGLGLLFAGVNLAGLLWWAAGHGSAPFIGAVILGQAALRRYRPAIKQIALGVEKPARSLALFARLLARLELETFDSPVLRDLAARLDLAERPSTRVGKLQRLCELLEFRGNELFAPLDALLLWTFQIALAVEAWREREGASLARWTDALGELEALLSLAGYAYERPDDPFPDLVEDEGVFEGEAVGHPLIGAAKLVRNDVRLNAEQRLIIVSGSNMSGKSTYLRAIGVNAALAFAGGPVCARSLRLTVWQVGTSIQTTDSLQDGVSRFYAELLRLRQIFDLAAGAYPVLFLLDEILHGTNSHDRLIGAEATVRSLASRGASGFVTTHDLALTRIAEDANLHAVNLHFADDITDGKMTFDYQARPGVARQSNALALMRLAGLEV